MCFIGHLRTQEMPQSHSSGQSPSDVHQGTVAHAQNGPQRRLQVLPDPEREGGLAGRGLDICRLAPSRLKHIVTTRTVSGGWPVSRLRVGRVNANCRPESPFLRAPGTCPSDFLGKPYVDQSCRGQAGPGPVELQPSDCRGGEALLEGRQRRGFRHLRIRQLQGHAWHPRRVADQ